MNSTEKRSLKITNSRQFQLLVSLMEKNKTLAKSLPPTGGTKISVEEAWNNVAREVNVYGPPKRTGNEWKKIWCDLKSRTKKKIVENNKVDITGEDSCAKIYLSELDQSIDRILDISTNVSSQVEESNKDYTFDNIIDDILKPYEVKTEPNTASNIQISTKKAKAAARLLGKRKHEKTEKQFKLLQRQVKSQEKMLEIMHLQATATQAISEAALRQAESMSIIAESTQSIALAVQDAVKYLKRD